MEGGIDPDAPLDYAEFELFPSQNRYEVCICSDNNVETAASGLLEQLLQNSPEVKNLHSKRPNATFKIQVSDSPNGVEWFTKSILTRFLHIVGLPDILNITKSFENEISQLEETRRFQLSIDLKAEAEIVSSDASKNDLLRAMDLRLTALREELFAALTRAAGASCSPQQLIYLETFAHHFGAMNIRNSLRKFVELSQKGQTVDFPIEAKFIFTNNSRSGRVSNTEGVMQISTSLNLDPPVKYGVSPAKAAQLERQSSTESEESSLSSEEDQPSVERSRTLIRSASPRRSASPMRRIQIGRAGSRRASTLTIKSLNYFPARERVVSHMDAANSEEEGSEQPPPRKSESNVQRISVQAAISLFESKQRDDQGVDMQKKKSNKSVLRRWSSGMGESSGQAHPDVVSESQSQVTPNNISAGQEMSQNSEEVKQSDVENLEKTQSNPIGIIEDTGSTQQEESSEKFTDSAEWSRQKEAELNQLLMKMMETKPVKKNDKKIPDNNSQRKNVSGEQRGGFYDHYKQKRDEKLRGEVSGKRAEKEVQFKAMQKFLDERKAEIVASTNASDVGRRHTLSIGQKSTKNSSLLTKNPKKETSKPAVVKKTSSKASPLPATRKSWLSTPSPRTIGTPPAKTTPGGTSSTGTTPTRRKQQPASSVPRSSPKVERPQARSKTVKATQIDSKNVQVMNEKKLPTAAKKGKTSKTKNQTPPGDHTSTAKPSLYNKVTKKSSVVPLESKPFLRKGSRVVTAASPVGKNKVSSPLTETLRNSRDVGQAEEKELVTTNKSDLVSQQQVREDLDGPEIHVDLEPENQAIITPQKCGERESSEILISRVDDEIERLVEPTNKTENEEEESSIISPAAWVEIEEEEYQDGPIIQYDDRSCQITTKAHVEKAGITSPRVRHSLSQMLLEESSEADITEWGNAENPPAMVYQKDAPKGLKRLLNFARKSKLDAQLSGWSTPSGFSEGEDEAEESKASKRNAENLLRKAALNATNYGGQKSNLHEAYEKSSAQSNVSKFTGKSVHTMQEGHSSASVTTSKATRSFFSLSAFKGSNKPNETKLR